MRTSHLFIFAVLGGAFHLVACSSKPESRSEHLAHNLVAELPTADVQSDKNLIDLGNSEAADHLLAGWSWNEVSADGTTFVWGLGEESELTFFASRRRPLTMRVRCTPFAAGGAERQRVQVLLNRQAVSDLDLDPGWQEYEVQIPDNALQPGPNRLTLRYGHSQSPSARGGSDDDRPLAVACDWLRFPDLPGETVRVDAEPERLYLPVGARVDYFLDLAEGAILSLDRLASRTGSAARLQVTLEEDQGAERLLGELGAGRWEIHLPLENKTGLARLRLSVATGEEFASSGGMTLFGPVIRQPWTDPGITSLPAGPALTTAERPQDPNIILYLVDTLRADRLGVYGSGKSLTPNMDAFAADAILFSYAVAQSSATLPSTASIFTGLWPREHGAVRRDRRIPAELETLPEVLSGAGYTTAAVAANGFISEGFGFADGFDHFVRLIGREARAAEVHAAALAWLENIGPGHPFFLYLHTIDPHTSYAPPAAYRQRFAPDVEDPGIGGQQAVDALKEQETEAAPGVADDLAALYDAEVAYTDKELGLFLDELRRRGLYDDSLIILVSDHGEEFYEHGSWTHGHSLHTELVDVPLIIRLPKGQALGTTVDEPVQHIDLLPTLVDLLGLEEPSPLAGRSLLSLRPGTGSRPRPIFSAVASDLVGVIWGDWKLLTRPERGAELDTRLYDRASDPGEQTDLYADRPAIAGYLSYLLRRKLFGGTALQGAEPAAMDEEVRRNLEALGYID
jgi:choline-sulfatase